MKNENTATKPTKLTYAIMDIEKYGHRRTATITLNAYKTIYSYFRDNEITRAELQDAKILIESMAQNEDIKGFLDRFIDSLNSAKNFVDSLDNIDDIYTLNNIIDNNIVGVCENLIENISTNETNLFNSYIALYLELYNNQINDDDLKKLKDYTKENFSKSWSKKINAFIGGVVKYKNNLSDNLDEISTITELFEYVRMGKPTNKQKENKTETPKNKTETPKNKTENSQKDATISGVTLPNVTADFKTLDENQVNELIIECLNKINESTDGMTLNDKKVLLSNLQGVLQIVTPA